jgi:spore maturation protein CgeB
MVLAQCRSLRPKYLLATGLAPISAYDLETIGNLQIKRLNFLTDDPWNTSHRSRWFLRALPFYDHIFNPRLSNLPDLAACGCRASYLPFAYSPAIHFRFPAEAESESGPDIAFIGGGDPDRVSALRELLRTSMKIDLYGGYWDRYASTRPFFRGMANPDAVRRVAAMAKVSLCFVRRANRDQSCMRTFELAAMGACILAEDSKEHREIYGAEGFVASYFGDSAELIEKAFRLLQSKSLRQQMRQNTQLWLKQRHHTYRDRLQAILAAVQPDAPA